MGIIRSHNSSIVKDYSLNRSVRWAIRATCVRQLELAEFWQGF